MAQSENVASINLEQIGAWTVMASEKKDSESKDAVKREEELREIEKKLETLQQQIRQAKKSL